MHQNGENYHFVLCVLKGKAPHWYKVYSFIAVDQQTNKCCFKSVKQKKTCHTMLEGICGCIMICTLFLTGPKQVSKGVHCFIAELIVCAMVRNAVMYCSVLPCRALSEPQTDS